MFRDLKIHLRWANCETLRADKFQFSKWMLKTISLCIFDDKDTEKSF